MMIIMGFLNFPLSPLELLHRENNHNFIAIFPLLPRIDAANLTSNNRKMSLKILLLSYKILTIYLSLTVLKVAKIKQKPGFEIIQT